MAKNLFLTVSLLLFVLRMDRALGTPEIRQIYLSQVGKMEHPLGSNWGHPVQEYLARVHLHEPEPWCAAFVAWCLDSAGISNTINGASGSAQNKANLVYYHTRMLQTVEPGDVGTIFFPSLHRIGHTFFTDSETNGIVETIEGNSNAGGSREGVGVFHRKRPLHTLWSISRWK